MKQATILLAMLVIMSVGVMGFREVDCNSFWWWNSQVCRDFELQDEFDEVNDMIDAVEADSKQRDKWLSWRLYRNAIHDRADRMYVSTNEEKWSKDEVGGSGTSFKRVVGWVMDELIPLILPKYFASQDRVDLVEAKATYGTGHLEDDYLRWAGLIKADRTGLNVIVGEFICHPGADRCIQQ